MKNIFRNIIFILSAKERKKLLLIMLLNTAVSLADILSIAFLFVVINFYSPQSISVNTNILASWHFRAGSLLPAALLITVFLIKSLFGYYVYKLHYRYINNVSSGLSKENLLRYLEGGYEDYVNIDSASFIRKICYYPVEFAHFILSGFMQVATELILIILTITALLIYDAQLLLIISAVLIPAIGFLTYITRKRLTGIRKNISTANERNIQFLHEALYGFVESNIYDKNKLFVDRYAAIQQTVNNYVADLQIAQGMPSRFFEAFAVFGLFLLIVAGRFADSENATGIFTLGAYMAAAYKIIPGISKIINFNSTAKTYYYAMDELVRGKKLWVKPTVCFTAEKLQEISLDDIFFSYKDNKIFNGFNCTFSAGSFTGIQGNSGKGKTTLINILLGFLSPDKGSILYNGKAIDNLEQRNYWNRIAYVKQEAFMLHDSILKNITLLEDNYDGSLLQHVIKKSMLTEFVDTLPEGIGKIITENGKNISGGQRQRIAIARALYKEADVIILDEPFNELDEATELVLMQHFRELADSGKIVILITHNSNSLQFCNQVISLDEE
ncbi:ABC transporter ATP-binding protein [Panacibacter ginsenosidivorans]|uniref:ABC transporter ATP-binding protein n=1 Tax=Panacibacter ginsenosidivorans TaxID=1813871 RepID=A0A5B8V5S0_9BACT|nr:ABC transporter ATP-binding protein [Panacibacter ginsenosidivorans]QEC66173.1 ABC transporter ATP-binding protein [Panacibacter ginsenosidivorans]